MLLIDEQYRYRIIQYMVRLKHHMESDGYTLQCIHNLPPPMHWGLRLASWIIIRLGSSWLLPSRCLLSSNYHSIMSLFCFFDQHYILWSLRFDHQIARIILLLIEDHTSIIGKAYRVYLMFGILFLGIFSFQYLLIDLWA